MDYPAWPTEFRRHAKLKQFVIKSHFNVSQPSKWKPCDSWLNLKEGSWKAALFAHSLPALKWFLPGAVPGLPSLPQIQPSASQCWAAGAGGEQGGCNSHSRSHSSAEGIHTAELQVAVAGCTGKMRLRDALTELSEHRDRADEPFQPLHLCLPLLSLFKPGDSLYRAGIRVISPCMGALCTFSLACREYLQRGTVHFIKCQFGVFFPLNAPFTCYHGGDRWPFVVVYSLENEVFE